MFTVRCSSRVYIDAEKVHERLNENLDDGKCMFVKFENDFVKMRLKNHIYSCFRKFASS